MRDTKYRFETLCIYDYRGVEEHLSAMAAKGWRLEKTGPRFWKYRRAEPANVRYAVTYSAGASQFNPGPTEGQQSLADLCADAGWEKVCDWFQMQIFCTRDLGALPLETDEALRLENIHRSMRKNFLPGNIVLLVIGLLMSFSFLGTLAVRPLRIFQRNTSFLTGPLFVLTAILEIYTLCHYYGWRRKSRRSIEAGGPCAPINTKAYQSLNRVGMVLVGLVTLLYLLMELFFGNKGMVLLYAVYASLFFLLIFLLHRTTALLRKLKASKTLNMLGTLALDVVLSIALIGGLTYGALHFGWFFGVGGEETYMYRGREWTANPPEDVPMTLSDLTGEDYSHIYRTRREDGSFFLPYSRCYEAALLEDGPVRQVVQHLTYEICIPRFAWLQEALLEDQLEDADLRISEIPGFHLSRSYEAEDPAPWHAEAVYRKYFDDTALDSWLLVWPGRVVQVEVETPTPEQMTIIAALLGPSA